MASSPTLAAGLPADASAGGGQQRRAFVIVTTLFFMWGFLTCLNDILVPHLKGLFNLSYVEAALVQFTFFAAYFVMAIPSGRVIERLGYKGAMVAGLVTAGVGALLFYPASVLRLYPLFLGALFVLATGITILQTAANPYVTVLGPARTASSRLNLTQAFNSLGTTLAPIFGGMLILGTALTPDEAAASVQGPYIGLAVALFVLAGLIGISKLPRLPHVEDVSQSGTYAEALRVRHLMLGVLGIFLYVGAEVSIGSFLINFMGDANVAGLPETQAANFVAYYWGAAMVGRFIGAALLQRVDAGRLLAVCALGAALLATVAALSSGSLAMWAALSVGLFNSVMFPTIFALAVTGLGARTGKGSSLLVMAIVGGAIIPVAMGALIDEVGLQLAFLLPAICYLYIIYYGISGSRPVALEADPALAMPPAVAVP